MSEVCNVHVQKHDKNPISGHTEFFLKIFYLGREVRFLSHATSPPLPPLTHAFPTLVPLLA